MTHRPPKHAPAQVPQSRRPRILPRPGTPQPGKVSRGRPLGQGDQGAFEPQAKPVQQGSWFGQGKRHDKGEGGLPVQFDAVAVAMAWAWAMTVCTSPGPWAPASRPRLDNWETLLSPYLPRHGGFNRKPWRSFLETLNQERARKTLWLWPPVAKKADASPRKANPGRWSDSCDENPAHTYVMPPPCSLLGICECHGHSRVRPGRAA